MNGGKLRLTDFLNHIDQAIQRVERYTSSLDESAFMANGLVQDAVIRNFEILGEASRNVEKHSPGFAALHPELPLAVAYEMRNAVSHGYYKVNLQVVWNTA